MEHTVVTSSILNWAFNESQNCLAQGIITRHNTDHVWVSCTSYIAHGRLQFSSGRPIGIIFDQFNWQALDGPYQKTGLDYRHISDGDFNELQNELWFGIEGGSFPRVLRSAIVRYDADTLQFIDIHVHPTFTTLPWLVFDDTRHRAITCNWTNSKNQLSVFDATTMTWSNNTINLNNVPSQYSLDGIPLIQGGAMSADGIHFVLQSDDLFSTIYMIQLQPVATAADLFWQAQVINIWTTGLGNEREGIALTQHHLLSMGNRDNSWEHRKNAQIFVLAMESPTSHRSFGQGIFVGITATLLMLLCGSVVVVVLCSCCCRNQ